MSQYFGSFSIPMNLLSNSLQDTAVVPEPKNGSKTISFLLDEFSIIGEGYCGEPNAK